MINAFTVVLLGFLIICAICTCFSKNFLTSVIIFMSYSVIMSILWMVLESPDLAITEAAVGAGVTSVLFFVTLKKIHAMNDQKNEDNIAPLDEKEKDRSADM
jgi:uncharacterized MnhB-related membrane protein